MKRIFHIVFRPIVIISFLAILTIAASAYFYRQYSRAQSQLKQLSVSTTNPADQTKKLITQVGKLIDLPTNESPTVATITDRDKLMDQPFFTKAQNGDSVLIYVQAKKAILYRPSINKIVDITFISISTPSATPVTTISIPTPKI